MSCGDAPGLQVLEFIELFARKGLQSLTRHFLASPQQFAWLLAFQRDQMQVGLLGAQKAHYNEFLGAIIILTCRHVEAEEAERIGLVHRIVEGDLLDAGANFAREMTGYSLRALCLARDAVHRGLVFPLKDGLEIEADLNTLAFQTADAVEGMLAFLERRKPVFRDGVSSTAT